MSKGIWLALLAGTLSSGCAQRIVREGYLFPGLTRACDVTIRRAERPAEGALLGRAALVQGAAGTAATPASCPDAAERLFKREACGIGADWINITQEAPAAPPEPCPPSSAELWRVDDSSRAVTATSERVPSFRPDFYLMRNDWRRTASVSVLFGLLGGSWIRYTIDHPLRYTDRAAVGVQMGVGYYDSAGRDLDIKYANGVVREGAVKVRAVPVTLGVYRFVKRGFFAGKWGIAGLFHSYNGSIDTNDGGGVYKSKGSGAGLLIPFEGLLTFYKSRTFLRLDLMALFSLTQSDFKRPTSYVKGVAAMGGPFVGLSVGRVFGKAGRGQERE